MPRSGKRRSVEVPLALYERLEREARAADTTVSAILQDLITDAYEHREFYGRLVGELAEIRRELRRLAEGRP